MCRAKIIIVMALCIVFLPLMVPFPATAAPTGDSFFLAPDGNDDHDGSLEHPWRTLNHAVNHLSPGDVLYLREGRYFENEIVIDLQGTASAPITIQSYPGERAIIDGGIPDFQVVPNEAWEVVDPSIHLYRSKETVSYGDNLGGWLLDHDIQLMKYTEFDRIQSDDYDTLDAYMGPGVHGRDGRIYIRLDQNPNELIDRQGEPINPIPSQQDPNQVPINIFSADRILVFRDAAHIHLRNLDIGPAHYTVELTAGTHHIEFDRCHFIHRNIAILAREGTSNIDIHHCEVNMGFPEWIYWGDIKGDWKPAYYSGWNSFAIAGTWTDSRIHHNLLKNCFDGISVSGGSVNTKVTHNTLLRSRDDAIDLQQNVVNIEVAHNIIRHCFEGVSINNGGTSPLGTVYVHHNVIDVSGYHRAERPADPSTYFDRWNPGITFGGHGCGGGTCSQADWKIYSNTIIARNTNRLMPIPGTHGSHTKYNNLILVFGSNTYTPAEISAGNAFWRTEGGSSGFHEPHGLEVDPGFDLETIEAEIYDISRLWTYYRPGNQQILTPGITYTGLDWPGSEGVEYRGAIDKATYSDPTFADVPFLHPYYEEIEMLYQAGYTAGCGEDPLIFCPDNTMIRAESAVFIERGIHGTGFEPEAPSSPSFVDVPEGYWGAGWIEKLWEDGYTAGCQANPPMYCPLEEHTRAEGCVFFLRMMNGVDYQPMEPVGLFVDVPVDWWGAGWVESAYAMGLIEPCLEEPEAHFCPNDSFPRSLAASMLVRAKHLP